MHRKTKIVCTIGPASSSMEKLNALINAGMNVARLNFSHGANSDKLEIISRIKEIRKKMGRNIGILQDLSGPKIRVGDLPETGLYLQADSLVQLIPGIKCPEKSEIPTIPVNYPNLLQDVPDSARILLDDGLLELHVEEHAPAGLNCRVIYGGLLKSHKGLNFPDLILSERAPTPKDMEDLKFGIKQGVDFVALSFVQSAADIMAVTEEIKKAGAQISVIAKLERGAALKNLDSILEVSDGVMVARGDLGIETDLSMIPIYQKLILRRSNQKGVFTITATQMLDSMMRNPLPTRAEVTDVANAIYDGSDAIMLSGETAAGAYPVEAVHRMRTVADHVEENLGLDRGWVREEEEKADYSTEMAVAQSVCKAAEQLDSACIVAHTISGKTAKLISMHRPGKPIIAITPLKSTYYQLSLVWGIETILLPEFENDFLKTTAKGDKALLEQGYVQEGDLVVISAGIPASETGGTNVMKLHVVGRN
ncbi:Pyruvate kinase [subsurface metagenome]